MGQLYTDLMASDFERDIRSRAAQLKESAREARRIADAKAAEFASAAEEDARRMANAEFERQRKGKAVTELAV